MLRAARAPLSSAAHQYLRVSVPLNEYPLTRSVSTTIDTAMGNPSPGLSATAGTSTVPKLGPRPGTRPKSTVHAKEKHQATDGARISKSAQIRLKPRPTSLKTTDHAAGKKPLSPYNLSQRLLKMLNADRVDEAVEHLKAMPLDAQNAAVWNTVIKEVMDKQRYQLGYELYVDMKRRGFKPTKRTYITMFAGYMQLSDWKACPKQLDHVRALYQSYKDYMEEVRHYDPESSELVNYPAAAYVAILGAAGDYLGMFDAFNEMDDMGPLAPSPHTYCNMLVAISARRPNKLTHNTEELLQMRVQNGSDARLIWRHLIKRMGRDSGFQLDSYLIHAVLGCLAPGRPADQLFAFDIVRDYLGLAKPGEEPKPVVVPLSAHIVSQVVWLCNMSSKHRLAKHFFQQMVERQRKPGEPSVVRRPHVHEVLRACSALTMLGGTGQESTYALGVVEWMITEAALYPKFKDVGPTLQTFSLALSTCWRSGDWETAARLFHLMTGFSVGDFNDPTVADEVFTLPTPSSKGHISGPPDTATMSHLLRTALEADNLLAIRQCLRIAEHYGMNSLLTLRANDKDYNKKTQIFYARKLAKDVHDAVNKVASKWDTEESAHVEEKRRWRYKLTAHAKRFLEHTPTPQGTPLYEGHPLGSDRDLAAIDDVIDQQMTRRTLTSASVR